MCRVISRATVPISASFSTFASLLRSCRFTELSTMELKEYPVARAIFVHSATEKVSGIIPSAFLYGQLSMIHRRSDSLLSGTLATKLPKRKISVGFPI